MFPDLLFALTALAAILCPLLLVWRRRFGGPDWAFALGGFFHIVVWIVASLLRQQCSFAWASSLWTHDGKILSLIPFGFAVMCAGMLVLLLAGWVMFDRYGPNGDRAWREMLDRARALERKASEGHGA